MLNSFYLLCFSRDFFFWFRIDFAIMETGVNVKLATFAIESFIMLTLTDIFAGPDEPAGLRSALLRHMTHNICHVSQQYRVF